MLAHIWLSTIGTWTATDWRYLIEWGGCVCHRGLMSVWMWPKVNQKLCLQAQVLFTMTVRYKYPHHCRRYSNLPDTLAFHFKVIQQLSIYNFMSMYWPWTSEGKGCWITGYTDVICEPQYRKKMSAWHKRCRLSYIFEESDWGWYRYLWQYYDHRKHFCFHASLVEEQEEHVTGSHISRTGH